MIACHPKCNKRLSNIQTPCFSQCFFLFLDATSWCNFKLSMHASHRFRNIYYISHLPIKGNDGFKAYKPLDMLSHVTTIENSFSAIKTGFSPSPINDYSIVSKGKLSDGSTHPLQSTPVIWLSPSASVPVQESRYGNVAFSINFNSLISLNLHKFYAIEFVQYDKEKALRILLTENEYPLMELDPLDQKCPIFFDKSSGKWCFATCIDSRKITIEIITDLNIAFRFISYVRAKDRRPRIQDASVTGFFPVFIDDSLGYLFYCLVKKEINADNKYKDITENDVYYDKLVSRLEQLNLPNFNYSIDEEVDEHQNTNELVNELSFSQILQCYNVNPANEDLPLVQKLCALFSRYGFTSSPAVCLKKLFQVLNNYVQIKFRGSDNLQSMEDLMQVFFNHFVQNEGKTIKEGILRYVAEIHGRHL